MFIDSSTAPSSAGPGPESEIENPKLLEVSDLKVSFRTSDGEVKAVERRELSDI